MVRNFPVGSQAVVPLRGVRAGELKEEAKYAPGKVATERRTFRPIVSSYEERSSD